MAVSLSSPPPVPDWHVAYYKKSYAMKSAHVIRNADKYGLEWYAAYRWELIRAQLGMK